MLAGTVSGFGQWLVSENAEHVERCSTGRYDISLERPASRFGPLRGSQGRGSPSFGPSTCRLATNGQTTDDALPETTATRPRTETDPRRPTSYEHRESSEQAGNKRPTPIDDGLAASASERRPSARLAPLDRPVRRRRPASRIPTHDNGPSDKRCRIIPTIDRAFPEDRTNGAQMTLNQRRVPFRPARSPTASPSVVGNRWQRRPE